MDGKSLDPLKDNLEKLKQLFPMVFTEEKLDMEKFKNIFSEDINIENERYVLNWAGKSDAFKVLQIPTTATLKPAPQESVNFDTTQNIFIEGENLEVLKVLQKSYYNKIKCIIIDPPYNTGNDSFIYPDKFKESKEEYEKRVGDKDEEGYLMKEGLFHKNSKDSGHYHSNWLSMMYPRLFLAKNLLREDGAIFIFIDDNEVHNLRLIMNEIYGEENFIGAVAWKHTQQSKNDERYFSRHYNTIVIYKKTEKAETFRFERTAEHNKNYSNPDNDPNGEWRSGDVRSPNYRKTLCYEIQTPAGKIIEPPSNGWRWSEESLLNKIKTGEIIFDKDESKIIRKIYLKNQEGRTPENLWDGEAFGTTRTANAEIKELFNSESIFDTPKPTNVIIKILELFSKTDKNTIVLDFFAGSCTTAHAVLKLNKEDNGDRNFIMVQLPEPIDKKNHAHQAGYKTIAEIGKERIRRTIKKFEKEGKKGQALGFKVFKLEHSNFKIWRGDEITEENLLKQLDLFTNPVKAKTLKQEERINMLYELMLKAGYQLTDKIEDKGKYYSVNNGELVVALNDLDKKTIEEILKAKPQKVITLDNLFAGNDQLKTNTVLQMRDAEVEFKTV
jgi:adenine-specific DNA-methyltransferase